MQRSTLRSASLMALAFGFAVCFPRIPAQAQEPIRVNVNLVMLDATVKTKSGQIMNDLKKDDFEVREDGVAKKITVFSRDQLPLNVALVLDLSDSIGPFLGSATRSRDHDSCGSETRRRGGAVYLFH